MFSNYHYQLLALLQHRRIDSTICSIRSVVEGFKNRLANFLLRLLLRKQSQHALRCLFPKLNGVSGHSSAFFGSPNAQKKTKKLSV